MTESEEVVKKRARFLLAVWIGIGVAALFITVCLALLVVNAFQGAQTRATLIDCTKPGGECYENGQKQTASVVEQLIESNQLDEVATRRIVILAVTCATLPGNDTFEETQNCVDNQLAEDKEK